MNLDLVCPKYGCPLHVSILKHKFDLALLMLDRYRANPHILNPNGSNALHILFANFSTDLDLAQTLAGKLIRQNVNVNLVDNNGLTPLHVAIKKN